MKKTDNRDMNRVKQAADSHHLGYLRPVLLGVAFFLFEKTFIESCQAH